MMKTHESLRVQGYGDTGGGEELLEHDGVLRFLRHAFEEMLDLRAFAESLSATNKGLLFLPEPEEGDRPILRQQTGGYYDVESLQSMILEYEDNREAIGYLADMLEI